MFKLFVLTTILAVGYAAPQYGYEQPINLFQSGQSIQSGSDILGLPILSGRSHGGDKYLPPATTTQAPLVHKQFYLISAPEDRSNVVKTKHLVLGRPQKNYRVVFIKAPSSDNANIKYSAEFAPKEEKTVIYVLSKKDNDLTATDIATPAPTQPSKPEVFFIKYKTEDEARQAQKEIQDSWQAFQNSNRLQVWDYKKALVLLQAMYGVFPYYKVTVDNRFHKPHDYIITLEEGEIGLPDKYFYNVDHNDEIIKAYKLLLRDFAINMKIVSHEADLFADEIFHYEKRIVNNLDNVRSTSNGNLNQIQTLAELKTLAPSLPIFETVQAMFPHIKITEDTEVMIKDVQVLREMSIIMSTSDKKPIFNFIIWSLARRLMPYLSTEYRGLVENFDHAIYGRIASYPRWIVCSKIIRDWLPFAVDSLQQTHMNQKATQVGKRLHEKPGRHMNKTMANDQLLQLIFYTVRNQLQTSVKEADWIQKDLKDFINEKLTSIRLQIGIPEETLFNKSYINEYYQGLLLGNIFFAEHLESIWSFRKSRLEEKLKTSSIVDTIVSEMYTETESQPIMYSNILNMMIIKRSIAANKYYDYRYPIAMNFARIGTDILEVLIDSISTFVEQYKADQLSSGIDVGFSKVDTDCITAEEEDTNDLKGLSTDSLKSFHIVLSSAKISAKALTTFITSVDNGYAIAGASMTIPGSYESLKLTDRLRIPGLRSFNENELFTMVYMQKHCSTFTANKDYAKIKPHVEHQLAEKYLFRATWNHIQFLPRSSSCSVPDVRCSNIL